jgi:PilZ domain
MWRSYPVGRAERPSRYVLRVPCEVVRLRDFRLIADRVEDFSAGGLLVSPAEPVLTGEEVIVSMRFPATGEWLDAEAVVTRVLHGRRPGETARCLGLEFGKLDRRGWLSIHRNLGRTPPAPPRARPGRRKATWSSIAALAAPN